MNEDVKRFLRQLPRQVSGKADLWVENFQSQPDSVGDLQGHSARFDTLLGGRAVTGFQFFAAKGGKTYVFYATAPQREFPGWEPTFRAIATSLDVRPTPSPGLTISSPGSSPKTASEDESPKSFLQDPRLKYFCCSLFVAIVLGIGRWLGILKGGKR